MREHGRLVVQQQVTTRRLRLSAQIDGSCPFCGYRLRGTWLVTQGGAKNDGWPLVTLAPTCNECGRLAPVSEEWLTMREEALMCLSAA